VVRSVEKNNLRLRSKPEHRPGLGSIITTLGSDTITQKRVDRITEGLSMQYLNLLHKMLPANKENV
jgi:hypothetical protein